MNDIMVPECTVSKGGYCTIHQRKGTTLVMTRLSTVIDSYLATTFAILMR